MATPRYLACLLVVIGGCIGLPGDSPTTTPTLSDEVVHPGLTADVDIRSMARGSVHITVVETNEHGRGVVLNETYRGGVELEDDLFRENGNYLVTIQVNGTVEWNWTVNHFEEFDLRIHRNGTVDVTSHVIA